MVEKELLKFELNGCVFTYTGIINDQDFSFIHINCIISNIDSKDTIEYSYADILNQINKVNILEKANNIADLMNISYNRNRFINELVSFINDEYLIKQINTSKLVEYFNKSEHMDKLSHAFDSTKFEDRTGKIFNTYLNIYPYSFNNKFLLHVNLDYRDIGDEIIPYLLNNLTAFELELTSNNYQLSRFEKDTINLLMKIQSIGNVTPNIDSVLDTINMIKYCFDNRLFKNIDQL